MPTIRIPLVGSYASRAAGPSISTQTVDQYFENCFPEVTKNALTGKASVSLSKRPGFEVLSGATAGATGLYGAVVWTGATDAFSPVVLSFKKSGTTSTIFFSNAAAQIGSAVPNTSFCPYMDETTISGTAYLTASLVDVGTVEAWYFPLGGAWTQVSSAPLTTSSNPLLPDHAHMDGYQFFMTQDGKIYNTDLNTVSSVTATNFISANSFSDFGRGVTRYKNTIVGFGAYSTEFYYNAGNATGSVLSRITNADIRIGCLSRSSANGRVFMPIGDTVYWLGFSPETGSKGFYRLRGYTAEKVSTPAIDKYLDAIVVFDLFIAGSFQMLGMSHIMLGQPSATSMLCYCIDTGFWWRFTPGGNLSVSAIVGGTGASPELFIFSSPSTNLFYRPAGTGAPVWTDATSTYTMTAQTENIDLDTDKKKYWKKLRATYDRQASTSPITVFASDNDYGSFSTLGSIDTVSTNAQSWITRLGASRRRAWKFTHSTNTACRIKAIEIDYDVGES